jgi:iron complex transport system ATP-binding protein
MKKHLLYTKNLSIGYKGKNNSDNILHSNLNLKLLPGEFTCLLGPNGSGKSTLMKTFAGFHKSLNGTIYLDNTEIQNFREKDLARLISVVLTDKTNVGNMTIFELVSMGRHPYTGFFGNLTQSDLKKVYESIEAVGLRNMKHKRVNEVSDGESQKAMIAKALSQETPIILLDEPTAYLDLPSRIEIMQLLHTLSSETQKAILLSTHDLEQALRFADKIWLLGTENRVKSGMPEDLILSNEFKSFFERKGIRFDNDTGTFKITNPNAKQVKVEGDGVEYNWIMNALMRNGYTQGDQTNIKIEIRKNGSLNYLITHGSKGKVETDSVEHLINQIKSLEK